MGVGVGEERASEYARALELQARRVEWVYESRMGIGVGEERASVHARALKLQGGRRGNERVRVTGREHQSGNCGRATVSWARSKVPGFNRCTRTRLRTFEATKVSRVRSLYTYGAAVGGGGSSGREDGRKDGIVRVGSAAIHNVCARRIPREHQMRAHELRAGGQGGAANGQL